MRWRGLALAGWLALLSWAPGAAAGDEFGEGRKSFQAGDYTAAVRHLEAAIRADRGNHLARRYLAVAYSRTQNLPAAYYQSAWLAYFAPEAFSTGGHGRQFIAGAVVRERTAAAAEELSYAAQQPLLATFAAMQARDLVAEAVGKDRLEAPEVRLLHARLEQLTAGCRRLAASRDSVARAALAECEATWEEALALDPHPADPSAMAAQRRELVRRACEQAAEAASLVPGSGRAQLTLGLLAGRRARLTGQRTEWEAALAVLERAQGLLGDSPGLLAALAEAHAECGQIERAIACEEARAELAGRPPAAPAEPGRGQPF